MNANVIHQMAALREGLVTMWTLIGSVPRMDTFMPLQINTLGKRFWTVQALVRPFARVNPTVPLQICAIRKLLGAQATLEGTFTGMGAYVLLQIPFASEGL